MTQKVDPKIVKAIAPVCGELTTELITEALEEILVLQRNSPSKKKKKKCSATYDWDVTTDPPTVVVELSVPGETRKSKKERPIDL